jgi:hypothetical protein
VFGCSRNNDPVSAIAAIVSFLLRALGNAVQETKGEGNPS